jgi:hypothetical protein
MKTLTKGNPDGKLALELDETVKWGEAALRLGASIGSRASAKGYSAMIADLKELGKGSIYGTVNVYQQLTAEFAQHWLSIGNHEQFVKCMRPFLLAEEADHDDPASIFDKDDPVMAYLVSSQDDEDAADEERDPRPDKHHPEAVIKWDKELCLYVQVFYRGAALVMIVRMLS